MKLYGRVTGQGYGKREGNRGEKAAVAVEVVARYVVGIGVSLTLTSVGSADEISTSTFAAM